MAGQEKLLEGLSRAFYTIQRVRGELGDLPIAVGVDDNGRVGVQVISYERDDHADRMRAVDVIAESLGIAKPAYDQMPDGSWHYGSGMSIRDHAFTAVPEPLPSQGVETAEHGGLPSVKAPRDIDGDVFAEVSHV